MTFFKSLLACPLACTRGGELMAGAAFWSGSSLQARISDSTKGGICCQLLAQGMLWVCVCLTARIRENQYELQWLSFRRPGMVFLSIYLLQNREESSMLESAAPETKEINLWSKHNSSLFFKVHNRGVWGGFSSEYKKQYAVTVSHLQRKLIKSRWRS